MIFVKIDDIHVRGRRAIAVGGTHSYLHSLLWRTLVDETLADAQAAALAPTQPTAAAVDAAADTIAAAAPTDEATTNGTTADRDAAAAAVREGEHTSSESLHALLARVDAVMARRLHVNDRRKVLRALQVRGAVTWIQICFVFHAGEGGSLSLHFFCLE